MLLALLPSRAQDTLALVDDTLSRELPMTLQVSPAGQHLLHLMLCPNPRERITVAEVMRHPWFQTELPPPLLTINGHLTQVGTGGALLASNPCLKIPQLFAFLRVLHGPGLDGTIRYEGSEQRRTWLLRSS